MSNGSLPSSDVPVARLCHIIKLSDFDGYGFNLHAEKGKPGQYIGKVDEGSPADAAGLKQGDRIVEVNGVNISNENHKQVVQRIKALQDETKLLVVDSEADKYFRSKNIVIKSSLPNVRYLKTPTKGSEQKDDTINGDAEDTHSQKSAKSSRTSGDREEVEDQASSAATTPCSERKTSIGSSPEQSDSTEQSNSKPAANGNSNGVTNSNNQNGSLNLNMSAKELRAKLAARKKYDPKKDTMDFKKKYDIVQTL